MTSPRSRPWPAHGSPRCGRRTSRPEPDVQLSPAHPGLRGLLGVADPPPTQSSAPWCGAGSAAWPQPHRAPRERPEFVFRERGRSGAQRASAARGSASGGPVACEVLSASVPMQSATLLPERSATSCRPTLCGPLAPRPMTASPLCRRLSELWVPVRTLGPGPSPVTCPVCARHGARAHCDLLFEGLYPSTLPSEEGPAHFWERVRPLPGSVERGALCPLPRSAASSRFTVFPFDSCRSSQHSRSPLPTQGLGLRLRLRPERAPWQWGPCRSRPDGSGQAGPARMPRARRLRGAGGGADERASEGTRSSTTSAEAAEQNSLAADEDAHRTPRLRGRGRLRRGTLPGSGPRGARPRSPATRPHTSSLLPGEGGSVCPPSPPLGGLCHPHTGPHRRASPGKAL